MPDATVSRAFAFVVACCRWPVTADAVADLRSLAQEPLDWDEVLDLAKWHRVHGLVHHAMQAAQVACSPAVGATLAREALAIVQRDVMLSAETLRLHARFDHAAIPLLTLKGVALAQRVYGTTALKHGRDIDLLVPPGHALAALAMLEADGYILVDPACELTGRQRRAFIRRGHEIELRHPRRGTRVELHWRLSENPWLTAGLDVFAGAQAVPLASGTVRTPGDADLFVYLCVHGANHFWSRLKWLADLNALLGAFDGDVSTLYRRAQAHGAGLCAGQALLLCQRMFRRALPEPLRAEIAGDRRVRRLVAVALGSLLDTGTAAPPPTAWRRRAAELRWRFLLGRGPRFMAAQLAGTLTAPADVIRWPLPRPLHFIYPLIRLPSWVLRRR